MSPDLLTSYGSNTVRRFIVAVLAALSLLVLTPDSEFFDYFHSGRGTE